MSAFAAALVDECSTVSELDCFGNIRLRNLDNIELFVIAQRKVVPQTEICC